MKMTGNKILLDSSIVIEVLSGNSEIADKIGRLSGFSISAVALGELYIGVNRVSNKSKHLKMLQDFVQLCTIVDINEETAKYYGEITSALFKKGKPIPSNDIWIAATARQYGYTLVTRDKQFKEIDDVAIKHW